MTRATLTMPNITHGATRPRATPRKLLFVRQPARSVRRRDQSDRTNVQLTLGVIVMQVLVDLRVRPQHYRLAVDAGALRHFLPDFFRDERYQRMHQSKERLKHFD